MSVVDSHSKVYGFENLFVCDASVFPTSVGVNPQLTVMALASRAVRAHRGELGEDSEVTGGRARERPATAVRRVSWPAST